MAWVLSVSVRGNGPEIGCACVAGEGRGFAAAMCGVAQPARLPGSLNGNSVLLAA